MAAQDEQMNRQLLKGVMERIETWPEADQEELLEHALEIEARQEGPYRLTPEERAGIERGLKDAEAGRFASDEEIEVAFAKFRGK